MTISVISSMLRYDDGNLIWLEKRRGVKSDMVAGWINKKGYRLVKAGDICHYAHRIVWFMHNGPIPEGKEIDHINHDRDDNRIENLRITDRK